MKQQTQFNFSISPTVKWLVIANLAVWVVLQIVLEKMLDVPFARFFALYPAKVIFDFAIWQPLTYMFLHTYQVTHIFFNMLMLWFLGTELEKRWGRKFFLSYYMISGVGAALFYCVGTMAYYLYKPSANALVIPVMGASGAVFGLLIAYGIIFAERIIYVFGVFPMKAKYLVMMLGAFEFASLMTSDVNGGEVAYLCHLGGLASGYLTLVSWNRIQKYQWNRKTKKRGRNLRLVVDNDEKSKQSSDPKYWN